MKNAQTQALVLIVVFSGFGLPEIFEISRLRNKNGWRNRVDSFKLSTKCNQDDNQRFDCSGFNAEAIDDDKCSCSCSEDSATFTLRNKTPTCIGNNKVRELLTAGCEQVALLNNENSREPLRLLKMGEKRLLSKSFLHDEPLSCKPNVGASWYTGCSDTIHPLSANNVFKLLLVEQRPGDFRYQLQVKKVKDANFLEGGIINLKINCTQYTDTSSSTTEWCLLFKLDGTITCAVEEQILLTNISSSSASVVLSMVKSTPDVLPFSVSTTATTLRMRTTEISPTPIVVPRATFSAPANQITQKQSLVASQPSAGSNEELQQSHSASPSLGLIVGGSVSLPLILLLAGFLIYRHRKSSGKSHESTKKESQDTSVSMSPQVNPGFQTDEQNGYVTVGSRESTCASTCDVPDENNSFREDNASLSHYVSLEKPAYCLGSRNAPQEPHGRGMQRHHTSSNEKPVRGTSLYAALDTPEELHIYSPLSADEPVYNVLEEVLEDQKEPLYSVLDASPPDTQEDLCNDEPEYDVLERFPTSAGRSRPCFGTSCAEDPVYNVLEGPDANDTDDPRTVPSTKEEEPVYSVLDGPNNADNDDQPEYAVVIRKDLRNKGGVLAEKT